MLDFANIKINLMPNMVAQGSFKLPKNLQSKKAIVNVKWEEARFNKVCTSFSHTL